jgi:hypothetical protein
MGQNIKTPVGLLSFANLFEPRAAVPGGDERFSTNLVFDQAAQDTPEYKALVAAIQAEAKEFFGGKVPAGIRNPIRDAAEKEYSGYGPGKTYISAWTKTRPGIVGPNPTCEEIVEADRVFAGQRARLVVRAFGYNNSGNKGIALSLQHVQITKFDMPRLDGRKSARDEFADGFSEEKELEDTPF